MALYKNVSLLHLNTDSAFDQHYSPGLKAPYHGIYRCISCGDEVAMPVGHTLPPQNHRQHDPRKGKIAWQLLVYAQQH